MILSIPRILALEDLHLFLSQNGRIRQQNMQLKNLSTIKRCATDNIFLHYVQIYLLITCP
ncbi:hypothetical protein GLOIN_2v1632672 [Rhizophagus irregularis DAOM 181602=DAOM 197198]|uniref:Uncharacterized protein n=1 Tax=Rhizophagus irregularis (strain DAOM 181602 / DAOM 197198 / MUCL 43194) TaxID=747089 RepID=A0A2P4PU18_RHIID|nr:hypothetical protein GLOIN_2v1632672 [Rhizophagus irregularis DAOM 181602=DAOM 197198]POG68877.1 hypothetical protein GLOIN_2v1632672 [Rhizophagus irregularis DAOM 181602=DAOM 197198]|eukprot:XP_025175743.1 hypothetical protein GLOIN_2v1632672 [Rhizophagus irregularis DAOM 181602=DAOM 197198]